MENWNEKLIKALQLNGKAERSQANYIRTVRILTEHCGKTPDLITEEELQEYFLHRRNVSQWAPNTMKSCYAGYRFFFENVLKRDGTSSKSPGQRPNSGCRRCSRSNVTTAEAEPKLPQPHPTCGSCGGALKVMSFSLPYQYMARAV